MTLRASLAFALLLGSVAMAGPAHAVTASVVVHKLAIDIEVHPDGTSTTTVHREQSPTSGAAAAQIGQYAINFNPSLERVDIVEAYTQKRDGSHVPLDLGAVRSQLLPGVPNVPVYRDVQQKVLVFPDLGTDDTEMLSYRKHNDTTLFPGQFFWEINFPRTVAWEDVAVSITAPATYPLHTESFGVAFERSEQDGVVRYDWHHRATDVISEDMGVLSVWDRLPRIFVSSFPDYRALADAYAKLAEPKAEVTPAIQQRADAITDGIFDRRAQAQAIYAWVSGHIRYVALYLAAGGVIPHAADDVMKAGYGDCKDHTVLFEALLKAKRIESDAVLVNLDAAYTLSGPPTLAQLNHVISYLPEFDLYADSTAGVAAFGMLPFQEYNKPAVLVAGIAASEPAVPTMVADATPFDIASLGIIDDRENAAIFDEPPAILRGDAGISGGLIRLPMLAPDVATVSTRTQAHIDRDGAIIGTTTTDATGPLAIALRQQARWVQTTETEAAARRLLLALGEPGSGRFEFDSPEVLEPQYRVVGHFKLDARPEILEGDSFAPPLGLQLLVRPGDFLLGPLNRTSLSESEATTCFPGRQVEELSLEVPLGRKPERLPHDMRIETPHFAYTSHWSLDGQIVRVHREMVSRVDVSVCSGDMRHQTADALAAIRRDQRAKIVLSAP